VAAPKPTEAPLSHDRLMDSFKMSMFIGPGGAARERPNANAASSLEASESTLHSPMSVK